MSKKHFIALAAEIKAILTETNNREAALAAAKVVSKVAQTDNPRFDIARFYVACGL